MTQLPFFALNISVAVQGTGYNSRAVDYQPPTLTE